MLDRGLTTVGLLGKDVDHDEEHEFALRTHDRVKAATRLVESLKGAKEPFDPIRGAGILIPTQRGSQLIECASNCGDPGAQPPALLGIVSFQALKTSDDGSEVTRLDHLFHLPLQEGDCLCRRVWQMPLQPRGDPLLMMKHAQKMCGRLEHAGNGGMIGRQPIWADALRCLSQMLEQHQKPATGPGPWFGKSRFSKGRPVSSSTATHQNCQQPLILSHCSSMRRRRPFTLSVIHV